MDEMEQRKSDLAKDLIEKVLGALNFADEHKVHNRMSYSFRTGEWAGYLSLDLTHLTGRD